ncbi:MAG TPA: hypothetical protein VNT54_12405, partial [Solirubrobacteraceae bacterium]|nr:hypothetical protein [Solirubrobacteraceae bacterium]
MSSGARIGLVAGTVAVLVLAFALLSPSDDDSDTANAPTATAPSATTPAQTTAGGTQPAPAPAPGFERIRVRDGQPVGGVQTITVEKGERARIQISSQDTTDEIHLHGYDLHRDLKAGAGAGCVPPAVVCAGVVAEGAVAVGAFAVSESSSLGDR